MPSLSLLWVILTLDVLVTIGHAVPLQESSPEVIQDRLKRAPRRLQCVDSGRVQVPVVTLYHYTDEVGYAGILETAYINKAQSPGTGRDDSRFGRGVYFTALGPETSDEKLAKNNWNGRASWYRNKLTYYFKCRINRRSICHSIEAVQERRDVWVFSGDRFKLGNYCVGRRRLTFSSRPRP